MGTALAQLGERDEALGSLDTAETLLHEALRAETGDPLDLRVLNEVLRLKADVLRALDRPHEAADAWLGYRRYAAGNPSALYVLGRELAAAAGELPPADQARVLDAAITALQGALAAGFDRRELLNEEPKLAPLRSNPKFQTLPSD